MIRRRTKIAGEIGTPEPSRRTAPGPPFRRIAELPPDESPTIVDPPGARAGSAVDEEATTVPMAAQKDRVTPYGQSLPSLDEVKDRLVAAAMRWARIYGVGSPVLEPIVTAIRAELEKRGIGLPKDERIVRQRLNENEALIVKILDDVERVGIGPDGILLPSQFEVRQRYGEEYDDWCVGDKVSCDPQREELLKLIVTEVRQNMMRSRLLIGMEEQQLDAAMRKTLERASNERLVKEPEPRPAAERTETAIERPPRRKRDARPSGSFINMRFTGRALGVGALAVLAASIVLGVARNISRREEPRPPQTSAQPEASARDPAGSKQENYAKAIFPYGESAEAAVIVKAGEIIRDSGPLHISQVFDIYDWVKTNIRYLNVMEGDNPRPAGLTLIAKQGDCKSMAALFTSMTASIGARTAVAVVEGHVYNLVRVETSDHKGDYAAAKEGIQRMVRKRYGRLIPRSQNMAFFENEEGLWLSFDATAGESGYPGFAGSESVLKVLAFGRDDLAIGIR